MCLLCCITAPKTSTSSMVRWKDEQLFSLLEIYKEIYVTHINTTT